LKIQTYYDKLLYYIEAIRDSLSMENTLQGEMINCNLLLNNTNLFYVSVKKLIDIL